MKKNFLLACVCALAFVACGESDELKHESKMHDSFKMTDDQMFAYLLGNQFGGQSFSNAPKQFGEYLDLDAIVQGIYDHAKFLKDSSMKMQLSEDSVSTLNNRYNKVMEKRMEAYALDSAKLASFGNDPMKIRSYVDSVEKTLPVTSPVPVKNQPVSIGENSSQNQRYSYVTGVQLHQMFQGVSKNIELTFDVDYFVLGLRETAMNFLDSSFVMQVPMDSLKAINYRYVDRMQKINQRRRMERMSK